MAAMAETEVDTEVDFGDSELFSQLGDAAPSVPTHIRFTEEEDEDEDEETDDPLLQQQEEQQLRRLAEENRVLRRQLNVLTRPRALRLEDVHTDGPLLQILYANNSISKLCRQEIEDSICNLIQKHRSQGNAKGTYASQIKPQNSALSLEEDEQVKSSSGIKTVTEAFKVVGSVLYFTTFSVDKLGQPLLDENPQLTDGWEIPTYLQIFNQVIGTDGQDIGMKERRPKSMCFNCGLPGHQIRDCPKPKDQAAINERRKEFSQNQGPMLGTQRYHAEVEERFAKYKAGLMSEELLSALGVGVNTLPPLIYRMRQLGYPPGWLKEAEMENSGLALYDGKDGESKEETNGQRISYDVSKLVDFPGFNVAASPNMKDEYKLYGSVPMQANHWKSNFAAYLSSSFPTSEATCNKRRHDSETSPHQPKKPRASPAKSSDMDLDSEPGTPHRHQGPGGFQFQPPLPPGSPSFGSPPPLPLGTPPATPTRPPLPKGTPPPTPTNGAAALPGHAWVVVDEAGEGAEDGLTLEELEEQQRLIWAALENADTATSSDCETQATGTSVPSSPGVSTPACVDTETEMDTEDLVNLKSSADDVKEGSNKSKRETPQSPGPIRSQEECPLSPGPIRAPEESPLSPGPIRAPEESPLSPGPIRAPEESPLSPGPIRAPEESPLSPGPIRAPEESPLSPGPIRAPEESPLSPGPIRAQEVNPLSPGPIRAQEVNPLSPGPIRAQEVNPLSPGPIRAQEVNPLSPGPIRAQGKNPLSPGPIRAQGKNPLSPGPIRAQDVNPLSPGPIRAQGESPLSPGPSGALGASRQVARAPLDGPLSLGPMGALTDTPLRPKPGAAQDDNNLSPNRDHNPSLEATYVEKVPHRSHFAAGIVPFEDTPEFTEVAASTGTYLRIRGLLKSSPRNVSRSNK